MRLILEFVRPPLTGKISPPTLQSFLRQVEKMFKLFHKKKYSIRRDGHRIYVQWLKPIQDWEEHECNEYLNSLWNEVNKSVDESAWQILNDNHTPKEENLEYIHYAESVFNLFIAEYGPYRKISNACLALYHGGMLVISFETEDDIEYPYYYRGIQVKAHQLKKP